MINALSPTLIIRVLSFLVMAVAGVALFFTSRAAASALWAVQSAVVTVVNALVFLLTFRPIFLTLYRWVRADLWWFPLLEGTWTGELRSNWPRVEAMMRAARGSGPPFDALADELPIDGGEVTTVEATIACSLFTVEMEIRIPGTDRISRTYFVRPQWCRPAVPRISYVYEQVDHGRVAVTDSHRHRGAAVLEYQPSTGELRGEYWTNREAAKGLNTAGTVVLRRQNERIAAITAAPPGAAAN